LLHGARALNEDSSSFKDAHHNHTMSEANVGSQKTAGPSGNSAKMMLEVGGFPDVERIHNEITSRNGAAQVSDHVDGMSVVNHTLEHDGMAGERVLHNHGEDGIANENSEKSVDNTNNASRVGNGGQRDDLTDQVPNDSEQRSQSPGVRILQHGDVVCNDGLHR